MPAAEELPSIDRLKRAYQGALVSERRYGDTHIGAIHMHWARLGAVLWRRQVERDAEEFRALYFNTARGERLDAYIEGNFPGKARLLEQGGVGTMQLARATASAGAGVIWAKTRIAVGGVGSDPLRYYLVSEDKPVDGAALSVTVNVEAATVGPDSEIHLRAGDRPVLRVDEPLWDNSWQVLSLDVGPGTLREDDDAVIPRITAELFEERLGYESAVIKAMKAQGASIVALFRSDWLGEASDHGLNLVYVADANFETSATLLRDCRLALAAVALAGSSTQVLPMTTVYLSVALTVRFWDSPEKFGMATTRANAIAAVVEYFETRENPFLWDPGGLRGAVRRAIEDTQDIEVTTSESQPFAQTIFNYYPIRRFRTRPELVTVTLEGPAS